jgi:hypothetical protein
MQPQRREFELVDRAPGPVAEPEQALFDGPVRHPGSNGQASNGQASNGHVPDPVRAVPAWPADEASPPLDVGTKVYVRSRYLGQWCGGFEVAAVSGDGYRIRRISDGHAFPDVFSFEEVHLERRHQPRVETSYLDRR